MIGLLVLAATVSCAADGLVVPAAARALVGRWASAREAIGGQGSWQRTLVVGRDGRVMHRGASYGLYAGQAPDDLSAEVVLYGRLGAATGTFVIVPDSIVTRDRVSGTLARSVQRDVAPGDSVHYALRGDTLAMTSAEYPSEALVRRP